MKNYDSDRKKNTQTTRVSLHFLHTSIKLRQLHVLISNKICPKKYYFEFSCHSNRKKYENKMCLFPRLITCIKSRPPRGYNKKYGNYFTYFNFNWL